MQTFLTHSYITTYDVNFSLINKRFKIPSIKKKHPTKGNANYIRFQ